MPSKDSVMSFDKYIDNPSGGASVYTNRNMYKQMYQAKFDRIMVRENGIVQYNVYRTDDKQDTYYIHMKIPSEVIEKFYYDVVIRLFTSDNKRKTSDQLREYNVQFYSNDPAFVYTFAHSFKKNNLFIPDLESKMIKDSLKSPAKIRNPKDEVWYVKSLYFAYLTMLKYNLFSRPILNNRASKYNKKIMLSKITDAASKVAARQEAQVQLDQQKHAEKQAEIKPSTPKEVTHGTKRASTIKNSKTTKYTKTTKGTKTTRRSKTT